MRRRISHRIDRMDRIGGLLFGRLSGSLVLLAVVAIGIPLLIGAVRSRDSGATVVVGAAAAAGLALVRYLFSKDRRLSDLE